MNDSHLFHCEACRADWRLGRSENEPPVEERFVERVLAAVRDERRRKSARFTGLAAAAALLFFFFAGAGREVATTSAAEQAYAQLDLSADLDSLLPD